jgi:arginyl-tRNA synthetase
MYFNIDKSIFAAYPDLKIGLLIVKGIDNSKRISTIESLLRGICAQREKQYKDKDLNEDSMIAPWNNAYGKFGINPNKNLPSLKALLKRVQSGKEIPHISALVDLYNYYSLKLLLPIGGEDLDWLCGDLNLKFTQGGEPFRPIGSIEVERANEGEVAYVDDGGITCRYWNYRECERTKFTKKTVNAALIIEDLSKMHMDEFGKVVNEVQEGLAKYIGGKIESFILTEENTSVDLKVNGRKTVDDSRIPQQEKAHFIEEELKKKLSEKPEKKEQEEIVDMILDENLLINRLKKILEEGIKEAFGEIKKEIKIEYPNDESNGDYASSIALLLAKDLMKQPREIAEKIIKSIPKNEIIDKVEVAGPGFINFFLSKDIIEEEVKEILEKKEEYGSSKAGENKTIIVEYSQPNIAKPLGIHHLLSTIIGQSLFNIYKKLGFNAVSINHIGDWGTQFGKLSYAYKKWGDEKTVEREPINELLKLYVKFHEEAEKNPSIEDEARKEFKKLEEGDEENTGLWKWFCEVSMEEIKNTYDFLGGINFDHIQGESFYNDKMQEILEKGKKEEVFVEGEDGSLIVKFENEKYPPYLVQKSDGASLYSTRDMAAVLYRERTWNPDKILYVVDVAQSLHFQQLFETAKILKLSDSELVHVVFGRMQFKDSSMSTRKGNIILLDEVLKEAVKRAKAIVEDKSGELEEAKKAEVAHKVGVGAAKYGILSQNRVTNITFDWDKMLSLEGNSAPYLQYSYARAKSILRKRNEISEKIHEDPENAEEKIKALIRFLPKFKEVIFNSANDYKPNLICNYVYELAQKFNSFYNSVPVLRAENKEKHKRLDIVEAVSQVLKNGLLLLGVDVVEEM